MKNYFKYYVCIAVILSATAKLECNPENDESAIPANILTFLGRGMAIDSKNDIYQESAKIRQELDSAVKLLNETKILVEHLLSQKEDAQSILNSIAENLTILYHHLSWGVLLKAGLNDRLKFLQIRAHDLIADREEHEKVDLKITSFKSECKALLQELKRLENLAELEAKKMGINFIITPRMD